VDSEIKQIKERLKEGRYANEASVSQGIVLPILNKLGWPVFNTSIVMPEYSLENRRVDYALCNTANKPAIFIEVKKVGYADGAERQLFEYAFHLGIPMAILTDGQEWSFYLPAEQGAYHERRVYKLNLLERSIDEAKERLNRYLNYERVVSGESIKSARSDYQKITTIRDIDSTFPKAWQELLDEQDSLLLDLLAEKVEDLCGFKPDPDACSQFLYNNVGKTKTVDLVKSKGNVAEKDETSNKLKIKNSGIKINNYEFLFRGKTYKAKSARDVMIKVFQLLNKEDDSFMDRYAARKHGKKRRYISKNKYELYPDREDLADSASVEVVAGWWLGTNYSRTNIQQIIDLAKEVAGKELASKLNVKVV